MSEQAPGEPEDGEKVIQQNLHGFLHPSQGANSPPPAFQLRMAQMELANRMRLKGQGGPGVPISRSVPTGGFGSAQGILHLRRGEFGKKLQPPPISPLNKHQPPPDEVIEVPAEAEVRQEAPEQTSSESPTVAEVNMDAPKRPRPGKRFKNPKL